MAEDGKIPADAAIGATVADAIEWAAMRFRAANIHFGHGTDNPDDEAAALVFHVAGVTYPANAGDYSKRLDEKQRRQLMALVEARISSRDPAAYLIGEAWFAGLRFFVDNRVLVPRSPIAELIGDRFEPWIDSGSVMRILDLCTGSGCIAIACAVEFPRATVDASDVSADALEVASMNVARHGLEDRVRLVHSDLFENLEGRRYDLIVSNPPYVSKAEMEQLPAEYTREPRLGLEAGTDGLQLARRILDNAREHLTDRGLLVVEVGASQPALEAAYPRVPFTWVEFEYGGEGVFLMSAGELDAFSAEFAVAEEKQQNGR